MTPAIHAIGGAVAATIALLLAALWIGALGSPVLALAPLAAALACYARTPWFQAGFVAAFAIGFQSLAAQPIAGELAALAVALIIASSTKATISTRWSDAHGAFALRYLAGYAVVAPLITYAPWTLLLRLVLSMLALGLLFGSCALRRALRGQATTGATAIATNALTAPRR